MKKRSILTAIALAMALTVTGGKISSVKATSPASVVLQEKKTTTTITASYEQAINEVTVPYYDTDGNKCELPVSEYLKNHLEAVDLTGVVDTKKKTIEVDLQLKNVFLNTDYKNGKSPAGMGYYNFLNYYTSVKQVKQMLDDNRGYKVIDNQGNKISKAYLKDYLGLLDQINAIDPTTNLKYDWNSVYDTEAFANESIRGGTDVIATSKSGLSSIEFHIDSHGWWGYDLGAHDSITGLVMGQDDATAYNEQHKMTMQYCNFFVIEMKADKYGTWYMLNGTDLENPIIYVSKDKREAFMIDVDMYGANGLNTIIKSVIGKRCKDLKIYFTHNHGDHVNNLAVIANDDYLRSITTIVWPENEPTTVLTAKDTTMESMVGLDLVKDIQWKGVQTISDLEVFKAAGIRFQFIEIPNEHTPGGGQLVDLDHKMMYSGDTLGAQIHLGGTTVRLSGIDSWIADIQKSEEYVKKNGIKYYIGGHTPYINTVEYINWVGTCLEYGKAQYEAGNLTGRICVITENGEVINNTERLREIYTTGLSDREELIMCSVNIINDLNN